MCMVYTRKTPISFTYYVDILIKHFMKQFKKIILSDENKSVEFRIFRMNVKWKCKSCILNLKVTPLPQKFSKFLIFLIFYKTQLNYN